MQYQLECETTPTGTNEYMGDISYTMGTPTIYRPSLVVRIQRWSCAVATHTKVGGVIVWGKVEVNVMSVRIET